MLLSTRYGTIKLGVMSSFRIDWPEEFPQQLCELSQWTVDCLVIYKCERISWLDISSCASVQGKTSPNIMRTGDLVSRQPVFNISITYPCLFHVLSMSYPWLIYVISMSYPRLMISLWIYYGYCMDMAGLNKTWIGQKSINKSNTCPP